MSAPGADGLGHHPVSRSNRLLSALGTDPKKVGPGASFFGQDLGLLNLPEGPRGPRGRRPMEFEQEVTRGNDHADGSEEERKKAVERDDGKKKKGRRSEKERETKLAKEKFLKAYKAGMSVEHAAMVAGIDRRTAYRWRDKDPEFAKAWREAREGMVEDLEMEAYKRAFKGNDRLLVFLLKSYKPVTYNQRQQQARNGQRQAETGGDKDENLAELVERLRECK